MRTPMLAFAALLLLAPAAPAAHAAPVQVSDPKGDAVFAAFDLVGVRFSADAATQRISLTFDAAPSDPGEFVVTTSTPACDAVTLTWISGADDAYLDGCLPRHQRWYAAPVWSGATLTFAIPRAAMPSWWAPGTTVRGLSVEATPYQDLVVAALTPPSDTAASDAAYVLGT